jgi:hypothetical protein
MGRTSLPKAGLSLAQHRALGARLRAIRVDIVEVRAAVKDTLGSATDAYVASQRLLNALVPVERALAAEAAGEYSDQVPMVELQRLYGDQEGRGCR